MSPPGPSLLSTLTLSHDLTPLRMFPLTEISDIIPTITDWVFFCFPCIFCSPHGNPAKTLSYSGSKQCTRHSDPGLSNPQALLFSLRFQAFLYTCMQPLPPTSLLANRQFLPTPSAGAGSSLSKTSFSNSHSACHDLFYASLNAFKRLSLRPLLPSKSVTILGMETVHIHISFFWPSSLQACVLLRGI